MWPRPRGRPSTSVSIAECSSALTCIKRGVKCLSDGAWWLRLCWFRAGFVACRLVMVLGGVGGGVVGGGGGWRLPVLAGLGVARRFSGWGREAARLTYGLQARSLVCP